MGAGAQAYQANHIFTIKAAICRRIPGGLHYFSKKSKFDKGGPP